jgi:hypothetical protein
LHLRYLNLSFFLLLAFLFSLCKDPYQFDTNSQAGVLVVDGNINDLPGPYILNLGVTTNPQSLPGPVSGALASVSDDYGNSESYTETGNGRYQLNGTAVHGIPGRSYTLHITLANGQTYHSTSELMPTAPKPSDSLFFKVVPVPVIVNGVQVQPLYANIYLNTRFEGNGGYFRWTVSEAYSVIPIPQPPYSPTCIVYPILSFYNLNVIDRSDYAGNSIDNILLISRASDFTFATAHYFIVTQSGMNSAAYNYWVAVQKLITNVGTVFQTPPYTIRGNMSNINNSNELVVGYFEASTQQIERIPVYGGEVPSTITATKWCELLPECYNCLSLQGSTTTIPDWWVW